MCHLNFSNRKFSPSFEAGLKASDGSAKTAESLEQGAYALLKPFVIKEVI